MKNLYRRLFGRLYWVQYSKELSYKGEWKHERFHGEGHLKYANGNTFTGSFTSGTKNGSGHYKNSNGFEYIGDWLNGHQTGHHRFSASRNLQRHVISLAQCHSLSQRFSNANRAAYCPSLASEFEYRHEVR